MLEIQCPDGSKGEYLLESVIGMHTWKTVPESPSFGMANPEKEES